MSTVVIIASYAPSLINFRGHLLKKMVSRGHAVITVAPGASRKLREQLSKLGVTYVDLGVSRTAMNPLEDFQYLLKLYWFFHKLQPDIVFSYTIKPVIYASIAARFARSAHIYCLITGLGFAFENGENGRSLSRIIARALLRQALKICNRAIFQNSDDLDELVRMQVLIGADNAAIVNGSGVDLEEFISVPVPDGLPQFLLIARLLKNKGIREYAEAARLVKASVPGVRFHLVGWFDENPAGLGRDDIEAWVQEGVLEYHGPVEDVRPWLNNCSVYVLPSYREGTPRTVLEAMATGRPIITTDVPGCRQTVIDGKNGYLVPPRDPVSLSCAMNEFIRDPMLAQSMGAESRRIAEQKYDVHQVSRDMLQLMGLN